MTAFIITVACSLTNIWLAYTLAQELRRKQDEINILNQKLIAWEDKLSDVIPDDFSDWWQSDRAAWPVIAAACIQSLKADNERAWKTVLELKKP